MMLVNIHFICEMVGELIHLFIHSASLLNSYCVPDTGTKQWVRWEIFCLHENLYASGERNTKTSKANKLQIIVNTVTKNKQALKVKTAACALYIWWVGKGSPRRCYWDLTKEKVLTSEKWGASWVEGTAGAKALRWEGAWSVQGTEWRPVRWGWGWTAHEECGSGEAGGVEGVLST